MSLGYPHGEDVIQPTPEEVIASCEAVIKDLREKLHESGARNGVLLLKIRSQHFLLHEMADILDMCEPVYTSIQEVARIIDRARKETILEGTTAAVAASSAGPAPSGKSAAG